MSAANNKKRLLCSIIHKLCFVAVISFSLMIAGCTEVLTVGAVVLGAAVIDAALTPQKPVPNNTPVARTYQPPMPQVARIETPTPPKEPDYQSMRDRAVYAYQDINWDKSEAIFKEFINSNAPERMQVESFIFLGAISYQRGDTHSAENYFKQAKSINLMTFPSEEMFPPEMIKFYKSVKR